jgi:hypothetical protein
LNKKAFTVMLVFAIGATFLFTPFSVFGQLGVYIYQVTPTSLSGPVGQEVNVQGTINTRNGKYEVTFNDVLVASGTADGFFVNANFSVPENLAGTYSIQLLDVEENAYAEKDFTVTIEYSAEAVVPSSPAILQEGSSVTLNAKITGGVNDTTYSAVITVMLPSPLNTNYSKQITLTTNSKGTAQAQLTFPDTSFQPAGSITDYAGTYKVFFNQTQSLSTSSFVIGFTDKDTYHRGQSAAIRAIGYQPNEPSTVTITYGDTGALITSESATASGDGIINAAWVVPSDARIGRYNIAITSQNNAKSIPDSQAVTIPGYPITIRAVSLAGSIVPQMVIKALDQVTNAVYNTTTATDGRATINLETGNNEISAYWNGVRVAQTTYSITSETTFDLTCELSNLKITVKNRDGFLMPFVDINISFQYIKTEGGSSQTGSATGQTDLSGTFVLNSTLPRISYSVDASLYGLVFNQGNNSIASLPAQPTAEAVILCPTKTVALKVVGYNQAPVANSRLELVEMTSGIFYGYTTDSSGNVNAEATFGEYKLRVYVNSILLNETVLEVFGNTQNEIRCSLYNIQISVKVVDYFGQSISNAEVVVNRPGMEKVSATTSATGTAIFNSIIGGSMQIVAYPKGMENSYEAVNVQVIAPESIQIKMSNYVLLGSVLIGTSLIVTIIIITGVAILFSLLEILRRKQIFRKLGKYSILS